VEASLLVEEVEAAAGKEVGGAEADSSFSSLKSINRSSPFLEEYSKSE